MLDFICMDSVDLFGTGRERKIQNENICFQRDSNPRHASPRQVTQHFGITRPRRLDDDQCFNALQKNGIQINKPLRDNTCEIDYGYMCI